MIRGLVKKYILIEKNISISCFVRGFKIFLTIQLTEIFPFDYSKAITFLIKIRYFFLKSNKAPNQKFKTTNFILSLHFQKKII